MAKKRYGRFFWNRLEGFGVRIPFSGNGVGIVTAETFFKPIPNCACLPRVLLFLEQRGRVALRGQNITPAVDDFYALFGAILCTDGNPSFPLMALSASLMAHPASNRWRTHHPVDGAAVCRRWRPNRWRCQFPNDGDHVNSAPTDGVLGLPPMGLPVC